MVAGRESVGVHPALDSKLVIDEISERLTANEREWTRRRGETKQKQTADESAAASLWRDRQLIYADGVGSGQCPCALSALWVSAGRSFQYYYDR